MLRQNCLACAPLHLVTICCPRLPDLHSNLRSSKGETIPGLATVPNDGSGGSDADWTKWIRKSFGAVSHPIGTAAMMRRSLGGVVDAHLKVYDTANVRVVDASGSPPTFNVQRPTSMPYASRRRNR